MQALVKTLVETFSSESVLSRPRSKVSIPAGEDQRPQSASFIEDD